jgi:hypothetical protein
LKTISEQCISFFIKMKWENCGKIILNSWFHFIQRIIIAFLPPFMHLLVENQHISKMGRCIK